MSSVRAASSARTIFAHYGPEFEMTEASATARLIRVEAQIEALATHHSQGQAEAQESRHRTNNTLMTMQGQLASLLEKIDSHEDWRDRLERLVTQTEAEIDARLRPLEADKERRRTIWEIMRVAIPGCFAVFTFMWQYGGSVMASLGHLLRGGR